MSKSIALSKFCVLTLSLALVLKLLSNHSCVPKSLFVEPAETNNGFDRLRWLRQASMASMASTGSATEAAVR